MWDVIVHIFMVDIANFAVETGVPTADETQILIQNRYGKNDKSHRLL